MDYGAESLQLHQRLKGKISVTGKAPVANEEQLSLAYTPGVAEPCRRIAGNRELVYDYTMKGNYVAVISDGSAVLGLGDIGPEAALPVMEGKCVLFKEFGGVDAIPLCLGTKDPDRIVEIVREQGGTLPARPDALALQEFLSLEKERHPLTFPDISLAIIKLIGSGEYVAEKPGREAPGHFGLAVSDYAHSTAPNRRYPDLIIQRLLKAALLKGPTPYSYDTLEQLARHLTIKEDDAQKVERTVAKSAAALMLSKRLGEAFEGVITGASEKGTWVHVLSVPVEGKLVRGGLGLDVGQRVRVKLLSVDVDRGFIDFQKM